jgi:hypothetical protein
MIGVTRRPTGALLLVPRASRCGTGASPDTAGRSSVFTCPPPFTRVLP